MPKKWSKLMGMRKLSEKQLDRAKQYVKDWVKKKDICEMFWVSATYLDYYGVKMIKLKAKTK